MPQIDTYLTKLDEVGGSDLHLTSGVPPKVRVHGTLRTLSDTPMDPDVLQSLIVEILSPRRREVYAERHDLDFAYEIPGLARFRVSAFVRDSVLRSSSAISRRRFYHCRSSGFRMSSSGTPSSTRG